MRVILYTGKGGVGKTSVAAATALRAAQLGHKTIVISTDPAHSLADSFDMALGADPVAVADNLWGQEVDVMQELSRYWGTVRQWLAGLMRWQGADDIVAEEVAILPGMEELVGLLYISRYAETKAYDVVIVDCAPTGETLRLLSFPEMARWYMQRLFPAQRLVAQAIGPVVRGVWHLPVPGRAVFDEIESLFQQLEKMQTVLSDTKMSSVRLVVNPERMVIKETQRTYTYLNLYGYATDLIVCNRVLPVSVNDAFFGAWKESHARYLEMINECFDPIPILQVPLMDKEVVGLEALEAMASALFDARDPSRRFYTGRPQVVVKEDGGYSIRIPIPFTTVEEVSVLRNGADLVVQVGRHRRNILLPYALTPLTLTEAKKDGETLVLRLRTPEAKGTRGEGKGGKK